MADSKTIGAWMTERGLSLDELVAASLLDRKVVEAIVGCRWTPSPQQRQRLAAALGVELDQIAWGHAQEVQHLHGHGPQFGRTP